MECSAYQRDKGICKNGFFQRHGCSKGYADTSPDYLPYCLRDELPAHWVDDAGRPAFIPSSSKGE